MSKPASTLPDSERYKHWREIYKITHDQSLPVEERLKRCAAYGDRVCIETQDDFLVHPEIKAARQRMADSLPALMKRAEQKQRNKATGQTEIEL